MARMRLPRRFSLRSDQLEYLGLVLAAAIVGVFGALGNLGFRALIHLFRRLFLGLEWDALGIGRGGLHLALIPIVLLSGGVAILLLDRVFPGDVLGYGFPDFLETVNLGVSRIKRRWIYVKALAAALSLGAGASVGREGPIAQIGGAIGAAVARAARLSPERMRVLVAAGAGAGIATTFNAPIGGLMFAQEIVLLGETELASLSLLVIATTAGVITSRSILGEAAVFHARLFILKSYWELMTYALLGVLLGGLGAFYNRLFNFAIGAFRGLNVPAWAKLAIGLGVVGLIAIPLPQNLSDGYPVIDLALAGRLKAPHMAALAGAKIVASSLSLGCGAPGGVFGPIFFIGTMVGGSFRGLCDWVLPRLTAPRGSYALVGLGTFLTATTHAPLTALFLLFEMTHDYQIALPAMTATIVALLVARAIEPESLDTYVLAREGKTLQIGRERLVLTQIPVESVMTRDIKIISASASVDDILRAAGETSQTTLPVIDADGNLTGIIVTHDLFNLLGSGRELGPLVIALDVCRRNCPTVTPQSNLDDAARAMEHEGLDEIPVVERAYGGRLLGLISRAALAVAVNRARVSLSTLATSETGIFWATGYRVSRIRINQAGAGKTLRGLDPRARFGVSVLALQDCARPDAGFAPVDPNQMLKTGDVIVVAGRPAGLRNFERALDLVVG